MLLQISPEYSLELLALETLNPMGLSSHYQFQAIVANPDKLDLKPYLQQTVRLMYLGQNLNAIMTQYTTTLSSLVPLNTIKLVSPMLKLDQKQQSKAYPDKTITQVIASLLRGYIRYQWRVSQPFPAENFVQYQQSDYQFLQIILAEKGLYWFFDQQQEELIITDQLVEVEQHQLVFHLSTGMIPDQYWSRDVIHSQKLLPQQSKLIAMDLYQVDQIMQWQQGNSTDTPGFGTRYFFNAQAKVSALEQYKLRAWQQALDWQRDIYYASSNCPMIKLGDRVEITSHPYQQFNQIYWVIAIEQHIDQRRGQYVAIEREYKADYSNQLTLIPVARHYRSPYIPYKIYHFLTATIIGQPNGQALLDQQGRYQIRFEFSSSHEETLKAVPCNQAYTGENSGIHFPLPAATKVLVAFVMGKMSHPVIIGAIPCQTCPGPITAANQSQSIMATKKQQLIFDDQASLQTLTLANMPLQQQLYLSTTTMGQQLHLLAGKGNLNMKAKDNWSLQAKQNAKFCIARDASWQVAGKLAITAEQEDVIVKSQQATQLMIGNNIQWQTQHDNVELRAKDVSICQQAAGCWVAEQGVFQLNVLKKSLQLVSHSLQLNSVSPAKIILRSPQAMVQLDSQGNIKVQANQINIKTDKLITEGTMLQSGQEV